MSGVASGQRHITRIGPVVPILAEGAMATEEQLDGGVGETRLTAHGQPSGQRRFCEGCSAARPLIRAFWRAAFSK